MRPTYFWILCALIGCHSQKEGPTPPPPMPVVAFQVQAQTIPADFQFVGVAKSSHPVEIRSRVEGYLLSIDYTEGNMVKQNDPLFQIDPRQFEASLEQAKGELEREEAILWRAKRALERVTPLVAKNAASQRDLDNATAQVLAGEASVIAAQANVVQAELNLSYTHITTPINGLTARAVYREGTLITPSVNGLLTLVSVLDPIWVYFSVSDSQILTGKAETAKNQLILPKQEEYTVTLTLSDGSQFPYSGAVNFASPTLDPETGAMWVRAQFPNPEGLLLPGQFVSATVTGAKRPNALFVPQKAVFQGSKGMYVFVINAENKAEPRLVEVGEWFKDYWIIRQGLQPKEMVIAEGVNKVKEGTPVKITSFTSGAQ